jgi:hypothetical protein
MISAVLQPSLPVDAVGATTTAYTILAIAVLAVLIPAFIASLISIAVFMIRRSARHRHA